MDDEYVSDFDEQTDAVRLGLLSYEDTHCVHGTFVGNWAGPDYMCGACESGITDEEWREGNRLAEIGNSKRLAARQAWDYLADTFTDKELAQAQLDFIQSDEGSYLFR